MGSYREMTHGPCTYGPCTVPISVEICRFIKRLLKKCERSLPPIIVIALNEYDLY